MSNIVWHTHRVTKKDREKLNFQKSCILWFTGLSGSGKSTIATEVEDILYSNGNRTYLLDGDNVRHGLNRDLNFSNEDRVENIRRIGEVAKLFVDSGIIVLTAFISPFKREREFVKSLVDEDEFIEIFIDSDIESCKSRDPKGLYKKALDGEIKDFTGVDSPYEKPDNPDIYIKTEELTPIESAKTIVNYLKREGYIDVK